MTIGIGALTLSVGIAGILGYCYYKLFNHLIRKKMKETKQEIEKSITPLERARFLAAKRREIEGTVDRVEFVIIERT